MKFCYRSKQHEYEEKNDLIQATPKTRNKSNSIMNKKLNFDQSTENIVIVPKTPDKQNSCVEPSIIGLGMTPERSSSSLISIQVNENEKNI